MGDASVVAVDGRAVVTVGGAEMLLPYLGQATIARDQAVSAAGTATSKATEASQYAAAAAAFANRYATYAAGNAATPTGQDFSVVDSAGGWINIYRKGTSTETTPLIQLPGKAAYAGGAGAALIGIQRPGAVVETVADYLKEIVYPDSFRFAVDADDRASFERARDYLVSRNGRVGGTIQTRMGRSYSLPGGVDLAAGVNVKGLEGLPYVPGKTSIPTISNSDSSKATFRYAPPLATPQDDRYTCPTISGLAIVADRGVDFGYDDNAASYYLANGWVENCFFLPYSTKGICAIRQIENYRGGIRGNVILSFQAGWVQKSGDINTAYSNRFYDCDIDIVLLSPGSTGTQTNVHDNDFLKQTAAVDHPEYGKSCHIYIEDRASSVINNYFEGQTGSFLAKDSIIRTKQAADEISSLFIQQNRIDYNSSEANYRYDFANGIPQLLYVQDAVSLKSPTSLTAVKWPLKYYFYHAPNVPRPRKLFWNVADEYISAPPMRSRESGSDLTIDAGNVTISSGNQGSTLYAKNNRICYDHDGSGGAEMRVWGLSSYHPIAERWNVEIDFVGTAGMTFAVQIRNGQDGYVDQDTVTCTGTLQTLRRVNIERTNMVFNFIRTGTTAGTIEIASIRAERAYPATTITDPTGGTTVDAEARSKINSILDLLQAQGLMA